jgi:hypothetical protein
VYLSVKSAVAGEDYLLFIVFDNGEGRPLDKEGFLDLAVFQRLKDYGAFRRVRIAFDPIEWASGIQLDPGFFYAKCRSTQSARPNVSKSETPPGVRQS